MDVITVAMKLVEILIGLVGKEKAAEMVSQAAIDQANAVADAIEAARFPT